MGAVAGIWRHPVKSAHGEPLTEARIEPGGVAGDRVWACVDDEDQTIGSAKHPRRWGGLLDVRAAGEPAVIEVGGARHEAGSAEADKALGEHLGRPGLAHAGLPADPGVLRTLARHYRIDVFGNGRGACFGVYADVVRPGHLELGATVGGR
jgi:hypothetical protein